MSETREIQQCTGDKIYGMMKGKGKWAVRMMIVQHRIRALFMSFREYHVLALCRMC